MNNLILHWQRIMRISILTYSILLLLSQLLLAESSKGQALSKPVSISIERQSLEETIQLLGRIADVDFAYDAQVLGTTAISVGPANFRSEPLERVLANLLAGAPIQYKEEVRGTVTLYKRQQLGKIMGKVTNGQGEPLAGASIRIMELNRGVSTDRDGAFAISIQPGTYTLEANYVSYERQSKPGIQVKPNGTVTVDFVLQESLDALDEVVITALGLTREEKSLGYAVTKLDTEDLNSTKSSNWLNSMQGKVPGLILDRANTGPSPSMRLTLRGDQSLNYNSNEALLVVDGIPISSGTTATSSGTNYANADAPVDFGNAASELNPEDIASVTVLKGPSATALYGSRAANGAVIITTKSGRSTKGIGVTVNSSATFERAGFWPDFQTQYGAGNTDLEYSMWDVPADLAADGVAVNRHYSRYAFGQKFDPNEQRYLYVSRDWETGRFTKQPWVYAENWYTGIFQTGALFDNTVAVDGNNGKGTSVRLSFTDSKNNWILPNTGYKRQNLSLSLSQEINKNIILNGRVNYYMRDSDNIPMSGYDEASVMYSLVWGQNVNDIEKTWKTEYEQGRFNRDVYEAGGQGGLGLVYPSANTYNPYRSLYEELNSLDRDRVFGNVGLTFNLLEGLSLAVRSGMDLNLEFRTQQKPKLASDNLEGFYREQNITDYEMNNDFLLRYERNFLGNQLTASMAFGGNNMIQRYNRKNVTLERLDVDGFYSLSNIASGFPPIPTAFRSEKVINSLYGLAQFGWNDMLFLDITGRNDWSSTLARQNNSYFYPSVSMSLLLDRALRLDARTAWIDLLKLRASWANVGNDTSPYALDRYYSRTDYSGSYVLPTTIPDPLIRPENVESWEAGVEGRFFKNRISADVTVYKTSTTNQIVSATTDLMSGASGMRINVGEIENKGLEISADFVPIRRPNGFNWSMGVNWYKNWNKLVSLTDDWDPSQPLQTSVGTTIGSRTYIYSFVGEEMHVIYGKDYQKAPEGAFYVNENGDRVDVSGQDIVNVQTGFPVLDDAPETRIGNVNPEWRAGMTQRFSYKNFSLGLTFTGQWGGNMFSVTNFALSYQGKLTNSLAGREGGLIHSGVNIVEDESGNIAYVPNETEVSNYRDYYNKYVWVRDNTANNTFDTSFLKLREARFDYGFPQAFCRRLGFLQSGSIGVFATNLFMLTNFPQFDPETGLISGTSIYKGIETMAFPMTRSFGLNLRLAF